MSAALPVEDVIEDAEWLDQHGTGAAEAARRIGFPTPHAMEKWLERQGRSDLWQRMKRRDPAGMHDKANRKKLAMTETTDTIALLLEQARKSTRARTRKKAERAAALVEELRDTIRHEQDEDRVKEAARKEVERLERQLAEAKARLRGGSPATTLENGPAAAEIRAWAAENGIECPAKGRVPADVRAAYEASQDAA